MLITLSARRLATQARQARARRARIRAERRRYAREYAAGTATLARTATRQTPGRA